MDVGEVAAADLEAVVCEVDLVEAVEVDSEEVKYKFIQYLHCSCNEFNHLCVGQGAKVTHILSFIFVIIL